MREMKDSGNKWIGDIPNDWVLIKLKNVCKCYGRIGFRGYTVEDIVDEFEGAITLSPSNIIDNKLDLSKCTYLSWEKYNESPEIKVRKNDLVLVKTASVGKCAIYNSDEKATLNPQLVVLKELTVSNKYLYYLFITDVLQKPMLLDSLGSVVKTITQKNIENYTVCVPTEIEQERIVNYLDKKCFEIESLTKDIQQQISKLEEYKKSVITEAVTKGLNSDVEMKDSRIEWIGNIPKGWNIVPLKYLLSEKMKYGATESGIEYKEELPRYIRITDIDSNGVLKDENKLSLSEESAKDYLLKDNTILFARSGATVGKTFLYKSEYGRAAFAGYLISATPNKNMIAKWLWYYTNSNVYWDWINRSFYQATIQNVGADKYSNMMVSICSLKEQKKIIDYLDKKCIEIDSIINSKHQQLYKLEEYKKSLIYEYVTGKKEVL